MTDRNLDLVPSSQPETPTLRELLDDAFEAGHMAWPSPDLPTRKAMREHAVGNILKRAFPVVQDEAPKVDEGLPQFINPGGPTSRCRVCHYPLPCGCVAIEGMKDALGASRPSPADEEAAAWEQLRAIADTPESKLLVEQLWAGFQGRQGR